MKKLLITGASGFIGKNLMTYFSNKYQLFHPSSQELNLLNTSAVDRYIRTCQPDYIIHAARVGGSRASRGKKNIIYQNLRMFFNLVKNENFVKKIIYFGSGAEYDKSQPLKKVKEEDFEKNIPKDDYGFFKYICAKYTQSQKNRKIICLRLFGVYGPYENYLIGFISNAIVKNLFHLPIVINQNVYFDYLYVQDLPKIVNYFLNHNPHHNIYNITSGRKTSLKEIAKIINKSSHFQSKIILKHSGLNNEYTGSNKRLLKEIKNLKFTTLELGIKKLFDWYRKRKSILDREKIFQDPYLKYCSIKN